MRNAVSRTRTSRPTGGKRGISTTAQEARLPVREKVGELFQDRYPRGSIIQYNTRARVDFEVARDDAINLLKIHDQATGGKSGRPKPELETLKRSALILAVTAWESFVEDTVTEQLDKLLKSTADPAVISAIFNGIADEWLDPARSGRRKPPELILWTGDKWKDLIRQSLRRSLDSFHTPNSEHTAKLFKRYLGVNIVTKWAWQAVSPEKAQKQLDALIKPRGGVVHTGRTFHPLSKQSKDVRKGDVVKALNLVYCLVEATEAALGVAPEILRCGFAHREPDGDRPNAGL
jgi:hypothetical protein